MIFTFCRELSQVFCFRQFIFEICIRILGTIFRWHCELRLNFHSTKVAISHRRYEVKFYHYAVHIMISFYSKICINYMESINCLTKDHDYRTHWLWKKNLHTLLSVYCEAKWFSEILRKKCSCFFFSSEQTSKYRYAMSKRFRCVQINMVCRNEVHCANTNKSYTCLFATEQNKQFKTCANSVHDSVNVLDLTRLASNLNRSCV